MSKIFLQKNIGGSIEAIADGDEGVGTFPKGICPKVNVMEWLEFEPAYYDVTVQTRLLLRHGYSP